MENSEERAPKNNENNEAKIEDLDEYEGVNLELADQKKTGLRSPEQQKECSETDGEGDLGKSNKRKERADTYTGEQTGKICGFNVVEPKMSKLIHADDLQNKTLEAVPNMEEANNDRKEPTEIKKNGEGSEEKEPVRIEDFPAFEDEFKDVDFLPLGSFWDHQIPLSPQESSNRNVALQPQMQTHGPSDESLMLDGISLDDLANDLHEEQGSASDLDGISLDDLANDLQEEVGSASDLDGISLADLDGP